MINLVMRPTKEPVVNYEGVYSVDMDGKPLGLTIRAKNAKAAEEKLRFVFDHELKGKRLDFKIEDFKEESNEDSARQSVPDGPERTEEDRAGDRGEGPQERVGEGSPVQ